MPLLYLAGGAALLTAATILRSELPEIRNRAAGHHRAATRPAQALVPILYIDREEKQEEEEEEKEEEV